MAILFSLWDSVFTDKELPMTLMSRVLDAIAEYGETGRDCTVGAGGGIFTLHHGKLYLTDPEEDRIYSTFSITIDPGKPRESTLPGGLVFRTHSKAEAFVKQKGIDEERLLRLDSSLFNGGTILRFAREGDKIKVKGGWKTVGRLLQDMGIPAVMRCRIPVLEDRDGICAVFGACCGGRDRISVKFRSSLARIGFPLYIVSKG
jgi:tRNA(Ile)-lysidine synthetase-like protein